MGLTRPLDQQPPAVPRGPGPTEEPSALLGSRMAALGRIPGSGHFRCRKLALPSCPQTGVPRPSPPLT